MAKRRYTVGIVGLGFGRAHIPAFQSQGCDVVAVCQRDAAKAREVAHRYGVPRMFERWEQMLEQARPDIVVIAAPPAVHHVIAVEALSVGAHVLCEKPLAMNAGEARAMIEAASRAGRVAMTCFNWRFPAAMQRLHAMVDAGFKAFSTDKPFVPEAVEWPGLEYSWAGDEHGRLTIVDQDRAPRLGDLVEFFPPHCDPTINLYDRLYAMRGDRVEAVWEISARGRSQ